MYMRPQRPAVCPPGGLECRDETLMNSPDKLPIGSIAKHSLAG